MNFIDFYDKVQDLKQELMKKDYDLEEVKIDFTKASYDKFLLALNSNNEVIEYIKW